MQLINKVDLHKSIDKAGGVSVWHEKCTRVRVTIKFARNTIKVVNPLCV